MRKIRYTVRVLYGTSGTVVVPGTVVSAHIDPLNGNAWYRKNEREYLVYPGEYEFVEGFLCYDIRHLPNAFELLRDGWTQGPRRAWYLVSRDHANEALIAVPPIYVEAGAISNNCFMMGEALTITFRDEMVYYGYAKLEGDWYATVDTIPLFTERVRQLYAHLHTQPPTVHYAKV
jgi:hypothetical protein